MKLPDSVFKKKTILHFVDLCAMRGENSDAFYQLIQKVRIEGYELKCLEKNEHVSNTFLSFQQLKIIELNGIDLANVKFDDMTQILDQVEDLRIIGGEISKKLCENIPTFFSVWAYNIIGLEVSGSLANIQS